MRNPLNFYKYLPHYLRRRLKKRLIAIESDDWGLERGLTSESIDWVKRKYGEQNFARWTTDALETPEDLGDLYDLLESFRDRFQRPPIVTANFITHNVSYSESHLSFRPISEGFSSESADVRPLYRAGMERGYIRPQLHGYSHYNLSELEAYFESPSGREAYQSKFLLAESTIKGRSGYLHGELGRKNLKANKLQEAARVFALTFGFRARTLIPPSFVLDSRCLPLVRSVGLELLQASNQYVSSDGRRKYVPYLRSLGGLIWSIRNARLDPYPGYNFFADECLQSIDDAFKNELPAIIDFHRVNFSGRYNPGYKQRTLVELSKVLETAAKKWPDAQFITSDELLDLLKRE